MNKPFQYQLLHGAKGAVFTAQHLKEARHVFKEIREALLHPDPAIELLRIPYFDFPEEWVFFLAMVGDDSELCEVAIFVRYPEKGIPVLGLGLQKDEEMWLSEEGQEHLGSEEVDTFGVKDFVETVVKDYLKG